MSKSKSKHKSAKKAKVVKKRDLSADEVKRAQKRLAQAISEMDAAQAKVRRRESDLEAALKRHGILPAVEAGAAAEEGAVDVAEESIIELPESTTEDPDLAAVAAPESSE